MTHEPECQHYVEEAASIRTGACIFCGIARAAYRRGREDAANAVGFLGSWLDETVDFADAISAARGDGEQA